VPLITFFSDGETPVRVAVSGALLAVMGVFMGMAFPMGMRLAMASRRELGPWLWGVNGAMSVLASVLAVVIAMALGISASFWTGVRSEEHTSELQSRGHLVCRLLLEKKKKKINCLE